jgi:S1-C subfamily serine protease
MRDRDEWRRPWTEGALGLPPVRRAVGSGAFESSGLDGAFDVADDSLAASTMASPYMAALRADRAPSAGTRSGVSAPSAPEAPAAFPTAVNASGQRARARGVLAGAAGGVAGAVLAVLALGALGVIDVDLPGVPSTPAAVDPSPVADAGRVPLPDPGAGAAVIPDVADRVLPTVVRINVSGAVDLAGAGALGSGVIYRSDGYIITNHHVIEGAAAVEVLLANGDRLEAEIVGSDVLNDLAVLRVQRDGLPAIDLRPDTEPLRVGETVVAIGSPFGLDATVTSGIISALNRDLRVPPSNDIIPAVIQTDAAINPGNSGGALVDLQGRLVGINTAIVSRTGASQGVGFAVSVQQAVVSSDQLIAQGFVRYPLLGITGTDVSAEVAQAFGLANRRGAVVDTVQSGSGADEGGMRVGDVIVAVDGVPLRSMSDLVAEVRRRVPGATVVFDVLRDAAPVRIEVVLGERPRS